MFPKPPLRGARAVKTRLAIVGCGAIAEAMHLPAAAAIPGVSVEALVDPDERRRGELQQRFRVPATAAALEEVAVPLDAVVICSPPHLHRTLAETALARGWHVLCEKPMANSRADCEAMISAARAAGRVLALAHIFRFFPARRAVWEWLVSGRLGAVRQVTVEQGGVYSWKTVTGYNMRRELSAGGVLMDAGIHPLDTLLWWFGPPRLLHYEDDAAGGLESNCRLHLQATDGFPIHFRLSRTAWLDNHFRIEGEEATLVLSVFSSWQYEIHRGGRIELHTTDPQPVPSAECNRRQMLDFVESIRGEHPPAVSGEEGTAGIGLIEQCYALKRARPLPAAAPLPGLTW